jgi:hypothetical protein
MKSGGYGSTWAYEDGVITCILCDRLWQDSSFKLVDGAALPCPQCADVLTKNVWIYVTVGATPVHTSTPKIDGAWS